MNDTKFANYTEDNTPFFVGKVKKVVTSELQNTLKTLF